jgi:hypothetical protein
MALALRLLLTVALLVPVGLAGIGAYFGIRRVWRSTVNVEGIGDHLREKFTPAPLLPLREEDALYREGAIVARVEGVQIDERAGRVKFETIRSPSWEIVEDGPLVTFRTYRLGGPVNVDDQDGTATSASCTTTW